MDNQKKDRLQSILSKLRSSQVSLQEIKKIYEKEKISTIELRLLREDREEGELQGQIYLLTVQIFTDYLEKICGGKKIGELTKEGFSEFSDQELDIIQ